MIDRYVTEPLLSYNILFNSTYTMENQVNPNAQLFPAEITYPANLK